MCLPAGSAPSGGRIHTPLLPGLLYGCLRKAAPSPTDSEHLWSEVQAPADASRGIFKSIIQWTQCRGPLAPRPRAREGLAERVF